MQSLNLGWQNQKADLNHIWIRRINSLVLELNLWFKWIIKANWKADLVSQARSKKSKI